MNRLDDKVIVDRKTLVELDKFARKLGYDRHKLFTRLNKALAQDLTGWVAVPVVPTEAQVQIAWTINQDDLTHDVLRRAYRDMLEASPPLPKEGK